MTNAPRRHLVCSFCGKRQDQVRRLIAGPHYVFICDQCVQLCNAIMAEDPPGPPQSQATVDPPTQARTRPTWWRRWLPGGHQSAATLPAWSGATRTAWSG